VPLGRKLASELAADSAVGTGDEDHD
jgi:hypothetical protein